MQLGGFSQSFSAQMISLKQIFASMLTRAKTHCEGWWKQNLSHIWFSAAKGFETGLQRCWRPQQTCLQELGLWSGTVKAVLIHTELANLQTSVQDREARLGLQESQGEQQALRNEAHWKYCQVNPGWDSTDERAALAELNSTPARCLALASNAQPFHSKKTRVNPSILQFLQSLKALYLSS